MNVTTHTVGTPADTTEQSRAERAQQQVQRLVERLHAAARAGQLNQEHAHGICMGLVEANAGLPPAIKLVFCAQAIEAERVHRENDPDQDCHNPMGQTNQVSCGEYWFAKYEAVAAAQLAQDLVNGPWPLY